MLDNLHDLDAYIDDRTLILNLSTGVEQEVRKLEDGHEAVQTAPVLPQGTKRSPRGADARHRGHLRIRLLPSPPPVAHNSASIPPPPSVLLTLRLPPAVAVAAKPGIKTEDQTPK
jgi:hypothetical protein